MIMLHPEGDINVSTKFQDISLKAKTGNLLVAVEERGKFGESPKSVRFHLLGTKQVEH